MLTVDYAFYRDTYHGTLPEADFERLSVFAAAYLDELTLDRIGDGSQLDERTRRRAGLALCAVAECRGRMEARDGIAAETNDGISVTYTAAGAAGAGGPLYAAAAVYLAPAGLLYRGVR